ncbi:MAG: YncE family protein [Chlamydiia bacterium]|nr:YncE family protein [Chlamydiia bacterium]
MKLFKYLWSFFLVFAVFPIRIDAAESVYVAGLGGTTLSVFDPVTNTLLNTIPLGATPREITITPDGTKAYVTEQSGNNLIFVDLDTEAVSLIPLSGAQPVTPIGIDSNNTHVFSASNNATNSQLFVVDTSTNSEVASLMLGGL